MIPRTMVTDAAVAPVVVVQFPDLWGRNVSPFGLKLEAWLRLADIPYTVEPSTNLGKAPKGKLPYIRDEGRLIGDTTLIIEHLKAQPRHRPRRRPGAARAGRGADAAAAVRGPFLLRPGLQPLDRRGRLGDAAAGLLRPAAVPGRPPRRRPFPPPRPAHAAPAGHRPPSAGRDLRHGRGRISRRSPTIWATGRS